MFDLGHLTLTSDLKVKCHATIEFLGVDLAYFAFGTKLISVVVLEIYDVLYINNLSIKY